MTSADWALGNWSVHVVGGEYRVRGARMRVTLNHHGSLAVTAARANAALLQHEQGHYDITGLIARDLINKVLDLSIDVTVVAALHDSGNNPAAHLQYAVRHFQSEIDGFAREANSLSARLQTNPTTQADGMYDTQTNHSLNVQGQAIWNARLQRIKGGNDSFPLALHLDGVI